MKAAGMRDRYRQLDVKRHAMMLEVVDARSGKTRADVLVDTGEGSFYLNRGATAAGDHLAVSDSENRILVYSLTSGAIVRRFFGDSATLSPDGLAIAIHVAPGRLELRSLPSGELRRDLTFATDVAFVRFSADSRRVLALTRDQTAFVIDASAAESEATGAASTDVAATP